MMILTKRKPVSVGEMLTEEFMEPLEMDQKQLADALGVSRKTANELCNNKTRVTVETAVMLSIVFGNSPDFWINTQKRNDLWDTLHSKRSINRIRKAKPFSDAAVNSADEHLNQLLNVG
jgi:antitoxin HigA-1